MQLSSVPASTINANVRVADHLRDAHVAVVRAQNLVERGSPRQDRIAVDLTGALNAATQAADGAASLGARNVLEGTFHRYADHAVRHLEQAVAIASGSGALSADAADILEQRVFDAEVATRLGSDAAARSLTDARLRTSERSAPVDGSGPDRSSGSSWVDGVELDDLGNPVRGSGDWAGPDGDRFGWDGSPTDDGSTSGASPDGTGYAGI